jgi:hypothetical protein
MNTRQYVTKVTIIPWHPPVPGPEYWGFRCIRCGINVENHPTFLQRVRRRIRPA